MKLGTFLLITVCLICPTVKGIDVLHEKGLPLLVFDKVLDRTQRSASNICQTNETSELTASRQSVIVYCKCHHETGLSVDWRNENCTSVQGNFTDESAKLGLKLMPPPTSVKEIVLFCSSGECIERIVITVKDDSSMSAGLQGFLIFLCVSIVIMTVLFVATHYKTHLYLGFRDTFSPTTNEGNCDIDAYISIGKNESDRKFLERNILDVLRRQHNYRFLVDDDNLLPRLEYSTKIQEKMQRCHLLIIVFTATYMTNDWCMYCFAEGLRKLLELNKPILFLVSDLTIQRELNSFTSLVGHVPKDLIATYDTLEDYREGHMRQRIFLPLVQTEKEKERNLRKIRLHLPAAPRNGTKSRDMRSPMLSDVEDIDRNSIRADMESYGGTETKYTFPQQAVENHTDDIAMDDVNSGNDDLVFDESEDPTSIHVKQYQARKDFYSLTPATEDA